MKQQIRVCRSARVRHFRQDLVIYGDWAELTDEMLTECRAIVRTANELFGPGSHWIELRDIAPDRVLPEVAVRALIDQSMQAWIEGDLERHLCYFTASATLITPLGTCHRGHEELRAAFAGERAAMPGLSMSIEERQITHPAHDTAIVVMEGAILHSAMPHAERWASTQAVVCSPAGVWRIASHHVFHARGRGRQQLQDRG